MIMRLLLAAVALLGTYGLSEVLKGRGMPTEFAHPQVKLDELPKTFSSWTGQEAKLDSEVFKAIGAEMAINRVYRDQQASVDLHSAVFTHYGVRILHPPELCYPGNGFVVANGETVEIGQDAKGAHPAQFLSLDREGTRQYCLYWYQIGDVTFWNGDQQRQAVQTLRGQTTWPPMIKVMLQTSASSPEEAQKRLKDLANLVYSWTKKYH